MSAIPISTSTFPIGKNGDCYDRYLIRMEEMRQSVKIMKQCCRQSCWARKRPARSLGHRRQVVPPKRGEMKRSMEALIHHFKLYTEGFHVPEGRGLRRRRSAEGRVRRLSGVRRLQQALSLQDPRARLAHLQAMDFICRGHQLADVSAALGSLDIVFGEVTRSPLGEIQ
jgi:NADH-quinone oxidoreductase subunit D